MTCFVKYIQDFGSTINCNMAHNETTHKYFLKAFYRRTNKKKYKLQILKNNKHYPYIIAIQNTIFLTKI